MLVVDRANTPIGTFVRLRREHLGVSQSEIARRADKSQSYIGQLEQGFNPNTGKPISPTLDAIEDLAKALKVSDDLLYAVFKGRHGQSEAELAKLATQDSKGRHVAAVLNIPGVTTGDRLSDLEPSAFGWIPWEEGAPADLPWVAVVGEVGCGQLRLDDPERPSRKFPIPTAYAARASWAVIARGDSLNALGPPRRPIDDGDLLLVRTLGKREPEHGMIVVAYVPDEGATAKVYWRKAGAASLRPWSTNPEHEAIAVNDQVQIVGEVFAVLPAPRELEGEA